MTAKKTTSPEPKKPKAPRTPKAPRPPKAPKPAKEKKPKRLSALDAAAQVLAGSDTPLNTTALVEQMAAKKLWESPKGKTPAATLNAAIIREIAAKKGASRFKKVGRGVFAIHEGQVN